MYFNSNKDNVIEKYNRQDNNKWTVCSALQLAEKLNSNKEWYEDINSKKSENTIVKPGIDNLLNRAVVIKTINSSNINISKNCLIDQLDLLNDIETHLLPEPLDYFNIGNIPILVLDYHPGYNLKKEILLLQKSGRDKEALLPFISRIARNILYFMLISKEKNYVHLGICPEHIIMLNNQNIRVVGVDKIHKLKNNKINIDGVKNRYESMYMPPEFYKEETDIDLDADAIVAFSLGVILCQMVCIKSNIEDFMTIKINEQYNVFSYPNPYKEKQDLFEKLINKKVKKIKRNKVKKLIADLCNPDPNKRLTDFNIIEKRLNEIG